MKLIVRRGRLSAPEGRRDAGRERECVSVCEREIEREPVCVYVCVRESLCVCVKERERESVCM